MIPAQPPDDRRSADEPTGPDLCTLVDEHWDALRREPGPDSHRAVDRDRDVASTTEVLGILNLLHQVRCAIPQDGGASYISTALFSRPVVMSEGPSAREAGAGASPRGERDAGTPAEAQRIGKYLVIEKLDGGGQSQVFRVIHPELAKEFVLKLALQPMATEDEAARDAPHQEARLLAQCDHPNMVRVIDMDVHEGRRFFVMEHVPGVTLQQFVARDRPGPRRAARLVIELTRVVAYLHDRGIIHLDIKPRNVLIDDHGRPRLIDLGMARVNHAWCDDQSGGIGGTAGYMSPEQAMGRTDLIGTRTDVFGLGGLLYHLLTGRPLYLGASRAFALHQAREADYVPVRQLDPSVPRSLERICHKALAADPQRRYPSAVELGGALRKSLERRWIAAGLVVMSLMAAVLFVSWPPPANPDPALVPPSATPHAETPSPPVALKIVSLKVDHWRDGVPRGPIDFYGWAMSDDEVQVSAQLDAPAYVFLIALNPDGKFQLCLRGEKEKPPLEREIEFGELSFPLTDGCGQQAFLVVASRKPLPAYEDWTQGKAVLERWRHVEADNAPGVWEFKDGKPDLLSSGPRGKIAKHSNLRPAPFLDVCEELKKLPEVDAIRAIAFPVKLKK